MMICVWHRAAQMLICLSEPSWQLTAKQCGQAACQGLYSFTGHHYHRITVREGCKIENRLNLGHCPNRREGGPKDCPNVPTLILNLIFNIINSNVVQHNSNVVQHTSNVVTLIEDESSKPSSPLFLFSLKYLYFCYQKMTLKKIKLASQVLGEGGRSGRLGQCPKFNRFSILQPSLSVFGNPIPDKLGNSKTSTKLKYELPCFKISQTQAKLVYNSSRAQFKIL